MTSLKPCPFCGGEAETFNPFNVDGTWCVLCSECAAATGFEQNEAEAIAAWNTRAELGSGTCENSAKEWGEKTYYFVCSECGWNLANVGRASIELAAEMIKTCPNCGKRVSE